MSVRARVNLVAEVALVPRAAPAQLDGRGAQQVLDAAADRGTVRRHRARSPCVAAP